MRDVRIPREIALFLLEHASPTDPPCGKCDYRVGRSWDYSISGFNGCATCRESDRQASYVYLRDPADVARLRELMADAPCQHEDWSPPASRGKALPGDRRTREYHWGSDWDTVQVSWSTPRGERLSSDVVPGTEMAVAIRSVLTRATDGAGIWLLHPLDAYAQGGVVFHLSACHA